MPHAVGAACRYLATVFVFWFFFEVVPQANFWQSGHKTNSTRTKQRTIRPIRPLPLSAPFCCRIF